MDETQLSEEFTWQTRILSLGSVLYTSVQCKMLLCARVHVWDQQSVCAHNYLRKCFRNVSTPLAYCIPMSSLCLCASSGFSGFLPPVDGLLTLKVSVWMITWCSVHFAGQDEMLIEDNPFLKNVLEFYPWTCFPSLSLIASGNWFHKGLKCFDMINIVFGSDSMIYAINTCGPDAVLLLPRFSSWRADIFSIIVRAEAGHGVLCPCHLPLVYCPQWLYLETNKYFRTIRVDRYARKHWIHYQI